MFLLKYDIGNLVSGDDNVGVFRIERDEAYTERRT